MNVSTALLFITAMLAGCEHEKIQTVTPEAKPAEYAIQGTVTDATTGTALAGVSVNGTTTNANGYYEMTGAIGVNTLVFAKEGYQSVTRSVEILKVGDNQKVTYNASVALVKDTPAPTYKTVKYNIKGKLFDAASGANVDITTATIDGGYTAEIVENTFTVSDVKPGTYYVKVTATGYNDAHAYINVATVQAEQGSGDQIVDITIDMNTDKINVEATAPKYYIAGLVLNNVGATVRDAAVTIDIDAAKVTDTTTDANGSFNVLVPEKIKITSTSIVVVAVTKTGYKSDRKSQLLKWTISGGTYTHSLTFVLQPDNVNNAPVEDISVGGTVQAEVPVEKAEEKAVEEILKDEAVIAEMPEEAKAILEAAAAAGTAEEPVKIVAVPVEEEIVVELASTEAKVDETTGETSATETTVAVDEITLPKGTTIFYTAGETAQTAQNISIERAITEEKAAAAAREYDGQPDGVVFSKPLEIKFEVPLVVTEIPETTAPATGGSVTIPTTPAAPAASAPITEETAPQFALPLLYEQADGTWKKESGVLAEYNLEAGGFVGNVSHFSRFRFGYETDKQTTGTNTSDPKEVKKPYYTGTVAASGIVFNGKYQGGMKYDGNTPQKAVATAMGDVNTTTINYIAGLLENMVKSDNYNLKPTADYSEMQISLVTDVDSNRQIDGFVITTKEQTKTYTVKAYKKGSNVEIPITVKVKTVLSATLEIKYGNSHGNGHGGNGTNINAGGGIFDIE
ncbi:MAG: carboxypeptidase-like regulatory domain-containing protein [Mediterranea sp.]|nr:carboxypeptidase-like regulatory domain-containing protein [Mediterranea sp.]